MLQLWNRGASSLALLIFAGTCFAQNPEAAKFYRLDFMVKELEGNKVVNTRAYSTTVSTEKGAPSSIRTGSRLPAPTTTDGKQFNYVEIGTNIDCRAVQEVAGELSMVLTAEVTSTLQDAPAGPPVIRQNRWSSAVIVALKKPTVLFSSDDATSKRQIQLELTATPLK